MKIHVLGCHGSDAFLQGDHGSTSCHTCGFLLNDTMLLDAGTVANKLPLEAQTRIRHILLSHLHFDHIKGLPTLADNLSDRAGPPIIVAGLPEVMHGLHHHIFNGQVYPDFYQIPSPRSPVLTAHVLNPGEVYRMPGIDCTPILVNHTVPAAGFIIQDHASAFLYSGDTAATDALWDEARRIPRLKAAFIECSYPDAMENLAQVSKHLTPRLLEQELAKLSRPDVAVYVYHLKPPFKDRITKELMALQVSNLTILEEGQIVEV